MQNFPISPKSMLFSLWSHRQLMLQMTKREVLGRYRGSLLGIAWSFFNPVLMLAVYTFVFSVVFKSRWGMSEESKSSFAIMVFIGMIVHGLFAECVNKAPMLMLTNVNYVKKVVFPLEILPMVTLGSALFHTAISILVLLGATVLISGHISWTTIFIPFIFAPLVMITLAAAWILASIGVFIRDVGQSIGIVTTIMMFLSPMFYPVSALPESFRPLVMVNPLSFIMEQSREILFWGNEPDWFWLGVYTAVSSLMVWLAFIWFQKTRKGFADVL